ncbi:MAG: NAD(P)H-dependent oxidoreductase [Bradymonadaceae bacterium]|nr:NAD(P)H-dependent oxidoreductase [Lujinxingiaceae bacterium]
MKIFAFAASLRRESINHELLERVADFARTRDVEFDLARFSEFDMPLYNQDIQDEQGFPAGAEELKRRVLECDAMLIASPEYNFSMPGTLKNAVDWLSRFRPVPLRGKHLLLLSASRSLVGGNRGLWQTRVPFEALGTHVYPDMFSLAAAHKAWGEDGKLEDAALQERLEALVTSFIKFAGR